MIRDFNGRNTLEFQVNYWSSEHVSGIGIEDIIFRASFSSNITGQ